MGELFAHSITVVNLPYTVLLVCVFGYWALYLIGALGSDVLDVFDLGLDADADVGVGVDLDADIDAGTAQPGGGGFASALRFFLVGEVPVVLIISILVLAMWTASILTTHYLPITSGWIAAVLFVPNFVLGMVVTKLALQPFAPLLRGVFDQTGDKVKVLGRTCVVISRQATSDYGQAEVPMHGAPLTLNVRTPPGETLEQGTEAVVYEHDEESGVYFITTLEMKKKPAGSRGETPAE